MTTTSDIVSATGKETKLRVAKTQVSDVDLHDLCVPVGAKSNFSWEMLEFFLLLVDLPAWSRPHCEGLVPIPLTFARCEKAR